MKQLQTITTFDSWVDEELERMTNGKSDVEIDFEEWDTTEPSKRQAYLESALKSIKDSPEKKTFISEYGKRAQVVLDMLHNLE